MKKLSIALLFALLATVASACAAHPDCTGRQRFPVMSSFVHLRNAGLVSDESVEFSKTEVRRLASEQIGIDLFRQVHHIAFYLRSGSSIEIIAVNDVSSEECSMSGVRVFMLATPAQEGHAQPDTPAEGVVPPAQPSSAVMRFKTRQ